MNIVCNTPRNLPSSLYRSLSAYRNKIFIERLGWDLENEPGYEQDQFDRDDTVHLVACDDDGKVIGCGRLLPTNSSYLLEEVFPHLLNGIPVPRSDSIWELSRFAITGSSRDENGKRVQARHLAERLLFKALQYCTRRGVKQLLAVSTLAVERLMLRAGVDVQRIGPPSLIDGQPVLAFVIQVNENSIASLSSFEADNGSNNIAVSPRSPGAIQFFSSTFRDLAIYAYSKELTPPHFSRQLAAELVDDVG